MEILQFSRQQQRAAAGAAVQIHQTVRAAGEQKSVGGEVRARQTRDEQEAGSEAAASRPAESAQVVPLSSARNSVL